MSKNQNLMTVPEVAAFYGLSTQTIRRRVKEAKEKRGSFPSPVFGYQKKALFHRSEVESWKEIVEPGEVGQDD